MPSEREDECDLITDILVLNFVKFTCIHKQPYELHCITELGIYLQRQEYEGKNMLEYNSKM